MIIVRVPYQTTGLRAAALGLAISRWCIDAGLKYGVDYTWHLVSGIGQVHVMLNDRCETTASMLALRWV